jgi:hypothetical protein
MVDAIQYQGNTDPRPLKAHKAPPPGMPASLCQTAHTTPDTPSHEDQTRIVLQDWETLKTELTSFWPSFTADFPYSRNALKKTMLLFHQDTTPKWKHEIHGHTYQAISQYLNMVKGFWNQEEPVPTDVAVVERPELGREPFHLAPHACEWHPPAPRQQPLVRPDPSPPWGDMRSTVNTYSQQRPDAEYQNQNTTSNASSSSTYGTSQDTWATWAHRGADHGRGPTH